MHHISSVRGRNSALAPAAVLLLALCLLAGGAQAMTDPANTAALVTGAGEVDRGAADLPVLADENTTSTLVISGPGRYELDHDLVSSDSIGVLITSSDVVFDGMGHSITGTDVNGSTGVYATGRFVAAEDDSISNVTVRNLTVRHWGIGLRIGDASDTVVEEVLAEQNAIGAQYFSVSGTTNDHALRDSVFRENADLGLDLFYPTQGIAIERCAITGNGRGISAEMVRSSASTANLLADSDISQNTGDGLYSHDGSFAFVRNCIVSANGEDGLEFEHDGSTIVGNRIENNGRCGINAGSRGGSNITGNRIEGNAIGVSAGGDWPSHVRNNVLNNTDNGYFGYEFESGRLNYTTSAGPNIIGGPFLGGNYWAFPNGTGFSQTHPDLNGDGFCDERFETNPADQGAIDYLPLALPNSTPTPTTTTTSTPAPTSTIPTPYRPHGVTDRIQAEDYDVGGENVAYHDTTPGNTGGEYRHDDVDIETGNGITDVGWIRTGEYLLYTVNVTETGDYAVAARVATPNTGCWISFSVDNTQGTVLSLPKTGSFETYTTATRVYYTGSPHYPLDPSVTATPMPQGTGAPASEHPLRLTAGTHVLKLEFHGDGQNLDWFELTPYVEPTPVVPTPYKALAIPGTIQAEDYDLGGEGVAYHDTTPSNEGGAYRHDGVDIETANGITDVGWVRNGEYLTYTAAVATTGNYTLTARVASPNTGRAAYLSVDGVQAATIVVPNTGSFDAYRDVSPHMYVGNPLQTPTPVATPVEVAVPIALTAGRHTLKLAFSGDGMNIDWIAFAPVAAPTPMPYRNVTLPGTIQAEDYDLGGEGVAFHDTTAGNSGGAYRADGVDVAALPAGGYAVVGVEDGEWLSYTVDGSSGPVGNLPPLVLYAASDRDGRSVAVEIDGRVVGNVSIPNTGNLSAPAGVQTQFFLTDGGRPLPGRHTIRLLFHGSGQSLDRIESPSFVSFADAYTMPKFSADRLNGTAPLVVRFTDESPEWTNGWHWNFGDGATSTEQNPVHTFTAPGVYAVNLTIDEEDHWEGGTFVHYWNSPVETKTVEVTGNGTGPATGHAIPGTIQAEDYNLGGEGVAYHDTTPGNEGGVYRHDDVDIEQTAGLDTPNVGWVRTGEYLAYTATVQDAGTYTLSARVASPNSGRTIAVSVDGAAAATIPVPKTGAYERFATAEVPVNLAVGTHVLKLTFSGDGQNIDWIAFAATGGVTTPTPEAGGASFVAAPPTAPKGSAVKFTVTPAVGKSIGSAWWSFDAPAHLNTWNSRAVSPTFFYPAAGTFSPLVKIVYTDGSTETVQRTNYVRAT
ncbi:MAG: carbohydrate-binding protein [Methanospirillum sp.]